MDIGIFKASGRQLKAWLIIPPLFIVSVGLGSHAWQQRAQWQLQKTKALSEVLPSFITARKNVIALIDGFQTSTGEGLGSEDQLISFLQDMAQKNNFMVDTVNVVSRKEMQRQTVPLLNAVVRGEGDFAAIQLYINEVKTEQRLLSVSSIKLLQPTEVSVGNMYEVEIIFDLLLLDELKAFSGGAR